MKIQGQISHESSVGIPASELWDVYGSLKLGKLVDELLGDVIGKIQAVEGDGGVGTIIKVTMPPGTPGPSYMKEIFTKVDNEKYLKESETIEGGYKDLGFDLYRVRFQVIEKDAESSIVRYTIEYEIDEEFGRLASSITTKPLETIAEVIGKHLSDKKGAA